MMAASGAGVFLFLHGLAVNHLAASGAFKPKALWNVDIATGSGNLIPRSDRQFLQLRHKKKTLL
jgi:hypothetical protein